MGIKEKHDPPDIGALLHLLQESDMEALQLFGNISHALRALMSKVNYSALEHSISNMEFLEAANILKREITDK